MRRIGLTLLFAACLGPTAGCQWARLRDPVPASLAASRTLCGEGNRLIEEKQLEKGEQQLAEAVKVCPTDCDARRYYAEALWMRNARQEAVTQLEEGCRLSPECDLHVRLAEMYLEMGRLDDASRLVDQVLGKNLKMASAWRVRGQVFRGRGDQLLAAGNADQAHVAYGHALNDLHRAAGYDPTDRRTMGETAALYRSLGNPQRALESMQSLAETYSPGEEPQQVLYLTGLDYMALQRFDDATTSLTSALKRDRPTPEMLYCLAQAQYHSGQSQAAAASLQQALVLDPQHLLSRQLLGQIEVAQQGGAAAWR
jgi:tetratricopeptide (TPR) repeat protein